eukprot:14744184-Ditylum_brightwellii.AAC.1
MSLDIVNTYPLVHVKLIQKALNHCAKNLAATARETINLCMGIVQAVKGKELLDEDIALAIGAYKSAFLADIVASYVFEETEECFGKCVFRGIYREDGLVAAITCNSPPNSGNLLQSMKTTHLSRRTRRRRE